MKKYFFFAAIAAIGLASCSSDETIASQATSESNEISFRPLVNGLTRGVDVNQTWVESNGFTVRATVNGTGAEYMPENQYTYNASTYTSTNKYYWPSVSALDFFAWAASGSDVSHTTNTYAFTVTPNATASAQSDLVVACAKNKTKGNSPSGVSLNFRHAESKVTITLSNSNASGLDFIIRDASICNVKNSGVFTFANTASGPTNETTGNTTSSGGTTLARDGQWSDVVAPATSTTSYTQAITTLTTLSNDWILIPQTFSYSTTYNDEDANDAFTAPCIKVSLKIKNHSNSAYIIGADDGDNDGYITAMWPLSAPAEGWMPGKKYTYTVDLAGGGYFDKNSIDDMGLDPIIAGSEIKFVTVTVDDWPAGEATGVYTGS